MRAGGVEGEDMPSARLAASADEVEEEKERGGEGETSRMESVIDEEQPRLLGGIREKEEKRLWRIRRDGFLVDC